MRMTLVRAVLNVGVFVILTGVPLTAHAANCLGIIGTQHQRCDFKRDDGGTDSVCTQVSQSMANPQRFEMLFPSGTHLRCTCEATGSFTVPKFDAAKDFLCSQFVTNANLYADAASGKVVGQKIKKGQYLDGLSPARSWVFECAPDLTCP